MSSKKVEDSHVSMLEKVLSDTGLVCQRSPYESTEPSEEEIEVLEEELYEEQKAVVEEQVQEEELLIPEEAAAEESSDMFPTPSLRRLIPERIRKVESLNRIKVLPDDFNTTIDPAEIPKIRYTPPKKYIDILAELTGCTKYKNNLAEYWFLDTLANLLRRAQEDELNRPTQAVLIHWFCEWIREMQNFDAASRERMLRRWKDNMFNAAKVIAEEDSELIPKPSEAGVFYKAEDYREHAAKQEALVPDTKKPRTPTPLEKKMSIKLDVANYECNLKDLIKIIHYIYDLFSTDFQYDLVRSIFTFTPEYNLINAPFQIEPPKRLYVFTKTKPKKDKAKKDANKAAKGKKQTPDTEEYLALMALKAMDYKALDEQEEREHEEYLKRSSILPLCMAATDEFFDNYWPPIVEETVTVVSVPALKAKKGKKK